MQASLLVNFHREGLLARRTLQYLQLVDEHCRREGIRLHVIVVVDNPDEETRSIVANGTATLSSVETHQVDFRNLGLSRTFGVDQVRDEIVFFLDGDDFISLNWFGLALEHLQRPENADHICHTQFFVGFGDSEFVRVGVDSRDPDFDYAELALDWYFCNNLACRVRVLREAPVEPYDHANGFGAEDWHWSAKTLALGYEHVLVPGTYYFYRIKPAAFSLGQTGDFIPKSSRLFGDPVRPGPAGGVDAENRREFWRAWADSLTVKESHEAALISEARCLFPIEPALTWINELSTSPVQMIVPVVDEEIVAEYKSLMEGIDHELPTHVHVCDVNALPGGFDVFAEWVSRAEPEGRRNTVCLLDGNVADAPPVSRPDWIVIDVSAFGSDWRQNMHMSRFLARLFVETRPTLVVGAFGRKTFEWLERYRKQIGHSCGAMFAVHPEAFPEPFKTVHPAELSEAFPDCTHLYLSEDALPGAATSTIRTAFSAPASASFHEVLAGEPPGRFSWPTSGERRADARVPMIVVGEAEERPVLISVGNARSRTTSAGFDVTKLVDDGQVGELRKFLSRRCKPGHPMVLSLGTADYSTSFARDVMTDPVRADLDGGRVLLPRFTLTEQRTGYVTTYSTMNADPGFVDASILCHDTFVLSADRLCLLLAAVAKAAPRADRSLTSAMRMALVGLAGRGAVTLGILPADAVALVEEDAIVEADLLHMVRSLKFEGEAVT